MPSLIAGVLVCALALLSVASGGVAAQVAFEDVVRDLSSPEVDVRLRALRLLKESGYPEAARPVAALLTDPNDRVQLEAIAAELNAFLADRVVPRRRVALIIEVRNTISAEETFAAGPSVLGGQPVPTEVFDGLGRAMEDETPAVAFEALYALGALGRETSGVEHRALLGSSGPQLVAMLGAPDPVRRLAAARVIGRLFARRSNDGTIPEAVGDAVIVALNDNDQEVRAAAMDALGAMRYERAMQALTQLFDFYRSGSLGERAFAAIAHIGHPASVPLFFAQLADGNTRMKVMSIEGLARTGTVGTLSTIQSALQATRNDAIRLAGAFAAARLSNTPIDALADALTESRLYDQAMRYLTELAPGRAPAIGGLLQSPDARVRADIADALGLSGDVAGVPLLEPVVRDADPQVARAGERALARLRRVN